MHISSFCKLKNVILNKESVPYFIKVSHIERYARSHRPM